MIEEPKYRFVLVNDQTGESFDLDTRHVCNDGIGKDSRPDIWSSCSARNEALDRLGYSVKVVRKMIRNNKKNQRILAEIVFGCMSAEEIKDFVVSALMGYYEEDDDVFEYDLDANVLEEDREKVFLDNDES